MASNTKKHTHTHINNSVYTFSSKTKDERFVKETAAVYFSAHNRIPKEPREKKRPMLQHMCDFCFIFL